MTDNTNQTRRTFLQRSTIVVAGGTWAISRGLCQGEEIGSSRPNVVLIITDDQGYGDLGVHGNDKIATPHLDRFSRESVAFSHFYVSPVCAPTRASLMTGRYNYRTGVVDTYIGRAMMHAGETTMADLFRAGGYQTGIFGKWHLGDNYPMRPIDRGFMEALVHNGGGIGQPSDPPGNMYRDPILFHNGKQKKHTGYCTDIFTDAAIRFIEKNKDRPFLAYLSTNAPHTPLEIDERYVQPYREIGLDETTAKVYGMVTNIDENLGRMFSKLRELNLEQNTIVIFMTDNGPQQPRYTAGLRGLKGTVYEGGIRVPCFIRWPERLQAGLTVDRIAAHIDLLPTLMDACGLKKPENLQWDGVSLMPLLCGIADSWPDRTLYFQWHRGDEPEPFRNCAAREQCYKLVDGKELYDLENDPGEQRDIAAERPEIVSRMRDGYERWFRDVSSTRGYAPPRIYLGTSHENPVTLTRQDWRGPKAGWDKDSLGYWEVDVRKSTRFEVTLRFAPAEKSGRACFRLGDVRSDQSIQESEVSYTFNDLYLSEGEGRLEAWIEFEKKAVGVHYVDVRMKE